ncbi:MAG: TldD/PmbA family protein [Candidatus Bathyarchaeia archaeon]
MISADELLSLVRIGVDVALQVGTDQVEAYGDVSKRINVSISGKHIHSIQVTHDSGVGIRSYVHGGFGFSYTMQLNKDSIRTAAEKATKLAKVAQKDPYFKSLPEPKKTKHVKGLYDPELASIQVEEASKIVENMICSAHEVSNAAILRGSLMVVSRNYAVANSLGVDFAEPTTNISIHIMSIVRKTSDNVGSGFEFDYARNLRDIHPEWVAHQATSKAVNFLGACQSRTQKCALLLSPNATWRLAYAMALPLDGQNVALENSCLADKIGARIAYEGLTLIDNGVVEKGMLSSSVDAEGTPKKSFAIIEKGVLKAYLHNSYTANRLKMKNNACAARDSYKSSVTTAPSNIQIKLGDQKLDDMIRDIKNGIYLDSFPAPDPVTGNVSSMIDFGVQIRNGEMAEPVKGTMIGANLLDLLRNISSISKETRNTAGVMLPYLKIENVQIAGK